MHSGTRVVYVRVDPKDVIARIKTRVKISPSSVKRTLYGHSKEKNTRSMNDYERNPELTFIG